MISMISMMAYEDVLGLDYYVISNRLQKIWLIPKGSADLIKASFAIYSPASIKGKSLKKLFPHIPEFIKKKIARPLKLKFDDGWLKSLFKDEQLKYSIFLGTPSAHQKPVIQIMDGSNNILAYMKLSDDDGVIKIIDNEANMIGRLQEKGVGGIPQILSYDTLNDYRYLIVDTKRTTKSRCDLQWNGLYEKCLEEFREKTLQTKKLKESAVYKYIAENLPAMSDFLSESKYNIICKALEDISKLKDKTLFLTFYHRDFKPWNCYINDGELQVYDFEYSMESAPAGLDKIHFFSQVEYLTKKATPKKIVKSIIDKIQINDGDDNLPVKDLVIIYALDMMLLYTLRSDVFNDEARFYYNMLLNAIGGCENG